MACFIIQEGEEIMIYIERLLALEKEDLPEYCRRRKYHS